MASGGATRSKAELSFGPRRPRGLWQACGNHSTPRTRSRSRAARLDGETGVGARHPSILGDGPIDWWPRFVRDRLWEPLGLSVGYQWLALGASVGLVLGGSQALARSLFAQITPEARSGEFFSFFGFVTRASAVFGPTLYVFVTAAFDTRVAVASIAAIIVAGTIALRAVDVPAGVQGSGC